MHVNNNAYQLMKSFYIADIHFSTFISYIYIYICVFEQFKQMNTLFNEKYCDYVFNINNVHVFVSLINACSHFNESSLHDLFTIFTKNSLSNSYELRNC